ncbi:sarcosine oxidase subunit gamma [Sulfitobacter sp. M57]|uniref:sarcosine oxidase subunit gamma n=1 Tax=unclassified Sulfitobacter TaxID=196795 RepID=UPI0023E201C7|nr:MULTISPECIES: sarcosine oxidase subunit gamma family protein [unclassified Sulfitobacter]MDF3413319.1 sarcosine oxidase subunit gamma [Sulfitobacter sp. KE5]MDF3421401.1 sarcosine oxidase subunit gamma [Sulfitobacter sp. KE43]MDF3431866.1 sarcosine oxidase subunit gamma [Sulfitobacter sp. KE42]MDF3457506.1 sarcosine oxidase subunit gamma [Sulfitobacter sp. S74]MDF3461408.1 sarcosine oxidase subunit gamma [Sulfitobacter sp. Ks18]
MSEPMTALKGASDTSGIATVTELGPRGMITLRGDLTAKPVVKAAVAAGGVTLPERGHCATEGKGGIAWMSPDELLILCDYATVSDRIADLHSKLAKHHALAVNVSDARAVFQVTGPYAREVIAKLAPVDMHPDQFNGTMFRRTRIAQVPAAFWMPDGDTVQIICFRSVAQYVFDVLNMAAQDGSEVGVF